MEPIILERKGRTFKDPLHIAEIETVILEIARAFRLIPSKSHAASVYTECKYVKRRE